MAEDTRAEAILRRFAMAYEPIDPYDRCGYCDGERQWGQPGDPLAHEPECTWVEALDYFGLGVDEARAAIDQERRKG